jgi:hypothetical protein
MAVDTTDVRSNAQKQIAHAVEVLGRSKDRRNVFEEIYRGKSRTKTVDEIAKRIGIGRKRVLEEGLVLYKNKIIDRTKIDGRLAFVKDDFYAQHKARILHFVTNKRAKERFSARTGTTSEKVTIVSVPVARKSIDVKHLTIDDIDSFERVAGVTLAPNMKASPILEETFQKGLQKILGEQGEFKDWGGEGDDLFSTRLMLNGRRTPVAFGLKGRGTKGKLTPKKLGKQGDQIQRLFRAPADVFLIQYWDQIQESVVEQMRLIAIARSSLDGRRIYYGVIDGQDTLRILEAYRGFFED